MKDKSNELKTNAMRIIEQAKVKFNKYCYIDTPSTNGEEVAKILNQNPSQVFKTLVTVGKSLNHYVFVVPVNRELDLRKGAKVVNEKNVEMIKQKELLPLTGYIHGGCSPIGMKKLFKTVVDKSALNFETILFSAGKIGYQVEISPKDLQNIINCSFDDICN